MAAFIYFAIAVVGIIVIVTIVAFIYLLAQGLRVVAQARMRYRG